MSWHNTHTDVYLNDYTRAKFCLNFVIRSLETAEFSLKFKIEKKKIKIVSLALSISVR